MITKAALANCGRTTQQGGSGVASDPYLTEPRACRFDPGQLLCQAGADDTSQCLTQAQVDTARLLYDGPRDPRTGHLIFPGVPRGSESGSALDWGFLQGISPFLPQTEPVLDGQFYWIFGPNWDWRSFDFDHDQFQVDRVLAPIENANNPDLTRFRARGGKLLGYHGWADPVISPQDFIDYYLRVGAWLGVRDRYPALADLHPQFPGASDLAISIAETPEVNSRTLDYLGVGSSGETVRDDSVDHQSVQEFFRLFMVPGMGHCLSGPARARSSA